MKYPKPYRAKTNCIIYPFAAVLCLMLLVSGCKGNQNKEGGSGPAGAAAGTASSGEITAPDGVYPPAGETVPRSSEIVMEVNGIPLTRDVLDGEVKKKVTLLTIQVPQEQIKQVLPQIQNQVVEDFIIKTLLSQEVKRLKIAVRDEEIDASIEDMKSKLPPGMSIEDMLRRNGLSEGDFRQDIRLGIQINKLVLSQPLDREKTADEEILSFYQKNREMFIQPETVKARHILISKGSDDDAGKRAEKKAKAEAIRKQLLGGADFAALALKNSDDPSRHRGGDLGSFRRGQMVKSFEDAAFSQKVLDIGPVVETDLGYHIVQVLERTDPQVLQLDEKVRAEIAKILEQQKRNAAFVGLVKKLKARSTVLVYGK